MTRANSRTIAATALLQVLDLERDILHIVGRVPDEQVPIVRVTDDSRSVVPQSVFVAVRGERTDGHEYIPAAVKEGAAIVICEDLPSETVRDPAITFVQVESSREALLKLTHRFYDAVADRLTLIGVTGTNGKTTTAHVIYHVLRTFGLETGLIGTLGAYVGGDRRVLELTTPGVVELYELWQEMEESGCSACVMEVSSHALDQRRIDPVHFDVGVFTNLSHDHLDYHEDIDAYARAKKRLFDGLPQGATAVYNADDPAGSRMVSDTRARSMSYGITTETDMHADVLENSLAGLRFRLDGHVVDSRLTGRFNVYNLLAAAAACRAVSAVDDRELVEALAEIPPVPGRLERFAFDDETIVFVDYAHTPDALEHVLETLRSAKPPDASLWCVFGCGGDRDADKRPVMGRLAERLADRVVVTSDNPRTEDPEAILDEIIDGMETPESVVRCTDRRGAIQYAARTAAPGDVVLIAGKGHETYQDRGTERVKFDDREEVKRYFRAYRRSSEAADNPSFSTD